MFYSGSVCANAQLSLVYVESFMICCASVAEGFTCNLYYDCLAGIAGMIVIAHIFATPEDERPEAAQDKSAAEPSTLEAESVSKMQVDCCYNVVIDHDNADQ